MAPVFWITKAILIILAKYGANDFFAELDYWVSRYNIEYIAMADELFAPEIGRAEEFCDRIKKYNIPWAADFRIDKINPELLPILKAALSSTGFARGWMVAAVIQRLK